MIIYRIFEPKVDYQSQGSDLCLLKVL